MLGRAPLTGVEVAGAPLADEVAAATAGRRFGSGVGFERYPHVRDRSG